MSSPILRRAINGVFLFDAIESGCNGEPNDGGRPRQDPETGNLWWNDSAIKRFFRNGLLQRYQDKPGHRVLIQHGYPLNRCQDEAFAGLGVDTKNLGHADDDGAETTRKQKRPRLDEATKLAARSWIAKQFIDVRWFGCVLDTGYQLGNLTGPLQFTIARTHHPVSINEGAVTRVTVTTEKDLAENKDREMGTKFLVPYALFRGRFFYTPAYGEKTGFSVDDFSTFIDMFKNPFSSRQSASQGMVTLRKAWIFLHDSALGNEQPGILDECVQVSAEKSPPQSMRDFQVKFDDAGLRERGVTVYTEENLDELVAAVRKNPGKAA